MAVVVVGSADVDVDSTWVVADTAAGLAGPCVEPLPAATLTATTATKAQRIQFSAALLNGCEPNHFQYLAIGTPTRPLNTVPDTVRLPPNYNATMIIV